MKLLLVGQYGSLAAAITAAAHKVGWEIYLLRGELSDAKKPPQITEDYKFALDSASVLDVVESIAPDVAIYMGAFSGVEPIGYISALYNLLHACGKCDGLKFFYLSSHEVFSDTPESIPEDARPAPETDKGVALAQGEELCINHARMTGMRAVVVRLDHLECAPTSATDYIGRMAALCVSAAQTGAITINAAHEASYIYIDDAVNGIFRIISAKEHKRQIYQLSSGAVITEGELAELFNRIMRRTLRVIKRSESKPSRRVLESALARAEFGVTIRHTYADTLPTMYRNIEHIVKNNGQRALTAVHGRKPWSIVLPLIENFVLGAAVFFFSYTKTDTGLIDPSMLYVMLMGGLYGKRQALLSVTISVCVALYTAQGVVERAMSYATYAWIATMFAVGMFCGHMRDRMDVVMAEKEEEFENLNLRLRESEVIFEKMNTIKREYETRLVAYSGSLGRVYQITSELDRMRPGEVLFSAAETTARVMDSRDVAIYQVVNDRFCRLFSSTTPRARALGKTIAYVELTDLNTALKERRVFINKLLDASSPIMASGIFIEDTLSYIIMIWGLSLEKITLYQANLLVILGHLIVISLNRARQYMEKLANENFIEGTNVMNAPAFRDMLELYRTARGRLLVDYSLIILKSNGMSVGALGEKARSLVRATDHIGLDAEGDVCVLLTNATLQEAQTVSARFTAAKVEHQLSEGG